MSGTAPTSSELDKLLDEKSEESDAEPEEAGFTAFDQDNLITKYESMFPAIAEGVCYGLCEEFVAFVTERRGVRTLGAAELIEKFIEHHIPQHFTDIISKQAQQDSLWSAVGHLSATQAERVLHYGRSENRQKTFSRMTTVTNITTTAGTKGIKISELLPIVRAYSHPKYVAMITGKGAEGSHAFVLLTHKPRTTGHVRRGPRVRLYIFFDPNTGFVHSTSFSKLTQKILQPSLFDFDAYQNGWEIQGYVY